MNVAQKAAVRNFEAYIKRDPTVVSVQPRHTTRTASGGKRWVLDSVEPSETVRIIPNRTTTEKQAIRVTPDGRSVMPGWMIAALPNTRIKIGALLKDEQDTVYEVVYVSTVPSWRKVFEAVQDGA